MSTGTASSRLIISLGEARKILGKKYESLNDDQIEQIIILLHGIAKKHVEYYGSKNL